MPTKKKQGHDKLVCRKSLLGQIDRIIDEFSEHAAMISEIQTLAKVENPPFEWQVIHMLKCQLKSIKESQATH
ncbi:hypothetical protein ACFL0M_11480 [Thermodesulfobacteriota bacterium]